MPEINRIENTFEYEIADAYLHQTNKLKNTTTWTYKGPDKLWIFVDNATKKIMGRFHYTERDNGADVPTADGQTKVLIDANYNPIIASLIHNETDYGTLEHTEELLPNDTKYGHPVTIPPDHVYELSEITYDFETGEFIKPYPWKQPHVTFADIRKQRNGLLSISDMAIRTCAPTDISQWEEYRQLLRDVPSDFNGIDPWKVQMPVPPGEEAPMVRTGIQLPVAGE